MGVIRAARLVVQTTVRKAVISIIAVPALVTVSTAVMMTVRAKHQKDASSVWMRMGHANVLISVIMDVISKVNVCVCLGV